MNSRSRCPDVWIIIGYIIAVLAGGALLAPWLFAGGKWLVALALERGWQDSLLIGKLVRSADKTSFPGFFNRAALIVAVAGLWPLFRFLRMSRADVIGTEPAGRAFRNAAIGFALAAFGIGLMGVLFSMAGVCRVPNSANWGRFLSPVVSGLCVAAIEEFLFRGAMLGVLRRSLRPRVAMLATTCFFAIIHFLKPPGRGAIADEDVNWTSGFWVVTQLFNGFGEWRNVVAEFLLLFAVGWVLAGARVATGGLGLSIGLHAGLVAAMKYFSRVTLPTVAMRRAEFFPWVSENHCKAIVGSYVGLAPIAMILVIGAIALWICKDRARA